MGKKNKNNALQNKILRSKTGVYSIEKNIRIKYLDNLILIRTDSFQNQHNIFTLKTH